MELHLASIGLPAGFWTGSGGFLRPSVQILRNDKHVKLRHSIWEIEVPKQEIDGDPHFLAFLAGKAQLQTAEFTATTSRKLAQLLLLQGGITFDGSREHYTLTEVRHIVGAAAAHWYGVYYAHQFWERLRNCELSLLQVFGWALRTYHLSRSAGPTAARGAVHSSSPHIRETFLKSALEEYSHCEIYYFPDHPCFGVRAAWIKDLLPLPSGTAFDQHMATIAEDNWLAHAISAYFQEYTASFRENAFALYDRLEEHYGLDGFFKGWKDHIGYDVNQTHADDFEDLFAGDETITRDALISSLTLGATTVAFLVGSLDELLELDQAIDIATYRAPPALTASASMSSTMMGGGSNLQGLAQPGSLASVIERLVLILGESSDRLARTREALIAALTPDFLLQLTTRGLANAVSQDEALVLGDFVQAFEHSDHPNNAGIPAPGILAIRNFLRESARRPLELAFLLELSATVCDNSIVGLQANEGRRKRLDKTGSLDKGIATLGLQFLELTEASKRLWQFATSSDVLTEREDYAQA